MECNELLINVSSALRRRNVEIQNRKHRERLEELILVGDAIPLEGRIVAVADVFDALTTGRAYKPAYPAEKAIDLMQQVRGQHFDPSLLDLFFKCLQEADEIQAA